MDEQGPGTTQRERRRQQHQSNRPKVALPRANLKQWIGPFFVLALVGGALGIMVASDGGDSEPDAENGCQGHYHYVLDIFIDGERHLLNQGGRFTEIGHNLHMHATQGADSQANLIHTHFSGGANPGLHVDNCFSYGDAMDGLSMGLSSEELVLRGIHGDVAGTYSQADGKSIRVMGQEWQGTEWIELDADTLEDFIPPSSSRIAIVYGNSSADIDSLLNNATTPFPFDSYPPDGSRTDPPHYVSFSEMRRK